MKSLTNIFGLRRRTGVITSTLLDTVENWFARATCRRTLPRQACTSCHVYYQRCEDGLPADYESGLKNSRRRADSAYQHNGTGEDKRCSMNVNHGREVLSALEGQIDVGPWKDFYGEFEVSAQKRVLVKSLANNRLVVKWISYAI